jgi:multiple sugar transport system substrate-binding protein
MPNARLRRRISRRQFLHGAVAGGGALAAGRVAGAQTRRATTIKMMQVSHAYSNGLNAQLGEFEQKTGIKAEMDLMSFPVLNQRADLELASGSGAYDVIQMVFIRSGRWIRAGWAEPLNPFLAKDQDVDLPDFVAGAMAPFRRGDTIYALPWLADSTVVGYRADILDKAGYAKPPQTFEALQEMAAKIHTRETAGFVTQDNLHWIWPNWLISYGGNFFAKPPDDLSPRFATPEAVKTAEMFATLLAKYSPPGGAKLNSAVVHAIMHQGKAAYYLDGFGNVQRIIDTTKTQLADRMAFGNTPSGPKGHFPQLAVHGYLINPASKKKEAAWEFIHWAIGKQTMLRNALEHGHMACTRSSVLNNPEVKKKFTWRGSNMPAIHEAVMKRAGDGYMAYRTIPQFPPLGDRVIIALTAIASGQTTAADGMKALQRDAEALLRREGVQIKG